MCLIRAGNRQAQGAEQREEGTRTEATNRSASRKQRAREWRNGTRRQQHRAKVGGSPDVFSRAVRDARALHTRFTRPSAQTGGHTARNSIVYSQQVRSKSDKTRPGTVAGSGTSQWAKEGAAHRQRSGGDETVVVRIGSLQEGHTENRNAERRRTAWDGGC